MTPASGKYVKYDLSSMLVSHGPKFNLFTNSMWGCIPNFIAIDVIVSELKLMYAFLFYICAANALEM